MAGPDKVVSGHAGGFNGFRLPPCG